MKSLFQNVLFKMLIIFVLIIMLIIPAMMVQDLIDERTMRQEEAVSEVSAKHALSQTITGPMISIPYKVSKKVINRTTGTTEYVTERLYYHVLPERLSMQGAINSEARKRGVFEVIVYQGKLKISANFKHLPLEKLNVPVEQIELDKAFISIGISDLKGLSEQVSFTLNDSTLLCNPGLLSNEVISSGLHANVNLNAHQGSFKIECMLDLKGSQQLMFVPVGKETVINLSSNWSDPSFTGEFIPYSRTVNNAGFKAQWKVLNLNRNFPQEWTGAKNISDSAFGVDMRIPVDIYQKTTRVAKYAMLFIVLTFLVFFFVEVINRILIHPIQYVLVGAALIIFYVLLLALSEQIHFNTAYVLSAGMTVGLVFLYSKTVLGTVRLGLLTAFILAVLYTFIFVIIQMQDYALLFGSLGLFVILALTMYISRKVDWFNLKREGEQD